MNGNPVTIGGVPLLCKHCGGNHFLFQRLPTRMGFEIGMGAPQMGVFICQNCSFVHWFMDVDRPGLVAWSQETE